MAGVAVGLATLCLGQAGKSSSALCQESGVLLPVRAGTVRKQMTGVLPSFPIATALMAVKNGKLCFTGLAFPTIAATAPWAHL
ncbi:MAG: hypothetical protein HC925_06525 [Coleofasciculaceae cyanobacterium SM2_3_26]|nr:hypothetical protein [Coleofasciculaceae cyanobacterium SM2_3_26]